MLAVSPLSLPEILADYPAISYLSLPERPAGLLAVSPLSLPERPAGLLAVSPLSLPEILADYPAISYLSLPERPAGWSAVMTTTASPITTTAANLPILSENCFEALLELRMKSDEEIYNYFVVEFSKLPLPPGVYKRGILVTF